MTIKRNVYQALLRWKDSPRRKPLILQGARQVGKTYLIKQFGAQAFADMVYINFEEDPLLKRLFQDDLQPERLLRELGIYLKKKIMPNSTLIFFDEIQECPEALNSLKYFCEIAPEYPMIAAGSLLGVKLAGSFPVGKVNFLHLFPLSFFEFLSAMGEAALVDFLSTVSIQDKIPDAFHERLLKQLAYYFVIGGMPEAVSVYLSSHDLQEVRTIQKEILRAYTLDFAKHAAPSDVMKIMAVWEQIPLQLAKENKKFIFSAIRQSARAREYESALQWLVAAGLVIKVHAISAPGLPLKAYRDPQVFKLYALDVGLLGAMSQLDPAILLEGHRLFEEFKGALTENFAAQMLQIRHADDIYYWRSSGAAELDFVLSDQQQIFPLEVKSGISRHKKSLQVFAQQYLKDLPIPQLSRANPLNLKRDDSFVNYPLYFLERFPLLLSRT